ncbi:MAG: hypothetical protein K2H09_01240, partial [Treponemataceae bacterium]|nr:hypothetical protein [Treponemataceae bacterium]
MMYSAALFRTFKENYVASTGSPDTQTNSDRQLWSAAAWLSYIYKVICGIEFTGEGITISPLVFGSFRDGVALRNFDWNGMTLDIEISGSGDKVASFLLDGEEAGAGAIIPYECGRRRGVKVRMEESEAYRASYDAAARPAPKFAATAVTPQIPVAVADTEGNATYISWRQRSPDGYAVLKNGRKHAATSKREFKAKGGAAADFYSVLSVAPDLPLLPGTPVRVETPKNTVLLEAEAAEFSGGRRAEEEHSDGAAAAISAELVLTLANGGAYLDRWGGTEGDSVTFTFNVKKAGTYALDFRFKNGHGPVNTGEKCAVRALSVNGRLVRRIAFPPL